MQKHIHRVAVGDEFDFVEGASRVVGIEHDPHVGTLVTLVAVPRVGCRAGVPVTIPIALLTDIVDVYDYAMIVPVDPSTGLEVAA